METLSTSSPRKPLMRVAIGLLVAAGILGVFQIGMMVGFRKASYAYHWGEQYHRMFAGPQQGFFDDVRGRGFMDAHGLFGSVLKVDPDALIIRDKDDVEKIVMPTPQLLIRQGDQRVTFQQIPLNAQIVVIGEPDPMGRVMARFIRLFDAGPQR